MNTPDFVIEIYLQPGEIYWGDADTRIKTLLGSCVALCLWHPEKNIGGMSHSLLPSRGYQSAEGDSEEKTARYIDESIEIFLDEIKKHGTKPSDYHVKFFGGGDMFKNVWKKNGPSVGERNIEMAKDLISKHGFQLKAEHVGGEGHRNIIFDLWSGDVWLKHASKTKEEEVK